MPPPLPKSVFLVGPESTGKTACFEALRHHLELDSFSCIPEVARRVMVENGWTGHVTNSIERQMVLLEAHCAEEERRSAVGHEFLSDRAGIDCVAYAKLLVGGDGWRTLVTALEKRGALERYRKGLVVLFEPVEAFIEEEDGVRVRPPSMARWWEVHRAFESALEAMAVPVGLRLGQTCIDLHERVQRVVQAVDMRE